ncbi:DUF5662 family protein [Actinoplanes rectilineatus]|uniref:DUF5662 family protein n=1 Tax=Actinoplanes rectilineatus TaxID=113571 RepID=UPI000B217027|nr:DUF5662 family protein [Actinoplanes rectilineatus]
MTGNNEHTGHDAKAPYDSRPDTLLHSRRVGALMVDMLQEGMRRAVEHDLSKTAPPEVDLFDRMTPRLKEAPYGSPAYTEALTDLKPALDHHYAVSRHHPQHFPDGVNGMTLVDLLELVADWKASGERPGGTGSLERSVRLNQQRFDITDQLAQILINTGRHFGWTDTKETNDESR